MQKDEVLYLKKTNIFIKTISVFICIIITLCSVTFNGFAANSLSDAQSWNEFWDSDKDISAGVLSAPGSDETQRNFSWYSPLDSGRGYVKVSENSDLSNAEKFYGKYVKTPQGDRSNKVTVSGLSLGTTYYYSCCTDETSTKTYSFTTSSSNNFSAVYVTDIHVSYDEADENSIRDQSYSFHSTLESALTNDKNISLILSAGDQASLGLRSEYTGLVASPITKSVSFATSIGNHDIKNVDYKYFKNNPNENKSCKISSYDGSDYWFVKGNALFLMLDTNCMSMTDHYNFIESAIAANPDVKWRILVSHHDLYGGRIEHRESENALRRIIYTPIIDKFKIDLALLGHSHYYTVSNVIYKNKTVYKTAGMDKISNPDGTIYMVSGSINRPRSDDESGDIPLGKDIATSYLTNERIYNTLDFTEDTLTVNSYTVESNKVFNKFTIEKTTQNGGHKDYNLPFYYPVLSFASTIQQIGTNINNGSGYKKLGEKMSVNEFFFGK